jgi:hypothetical protein
MGTIQEALSKVNIVSTNDKTIVAAPAVAPQVVVTPTPPIIPDVNPSVASSTPEGTPSASPDGNPAVSPDAHASVIEDEQSEINENEVPEGLRKRFSKLTTKNKLALKEAEEAKQQAEALRLEIEAEKREKAFYQEMLLAQANNPALAKPVEKPVVVEQPVVNRPPTLDDFKESENQLEDYIQARIEYGLNKGMQVIAAQTDPAIVEKKKKEEAFKKQYPDFASVMHDKNPGIKVLTENPVTDQIIGRTKDNLALLYHYAKNPADAQKLAAMTDPVDVAMELADLKSKLNSNTRVEIPEPAVVNNLGGPNRINPNEPPPVANLGQVPNPPVHEPIKLHVTKAPEPYNPIQSQASQTYPDVNNMTPDEMLQDPRYARLFTKKR